MKRFIHQAKVNLGTAGRFVWEATDNEDRVALTGITVLAWGLSRVSMTAALVTVGILLILAARPLRSWF